ncbi:MAG: hypothetical protein GX075_13415 [Firmicutes bacterium]|nr:hypothetical protein [Bacillota bacterium]
MGLIEIAIKIIIALPLGIWLYHDSRARDFSWLIWTFAPFIILLSPLPAAIIMTVVLSAIYLIARPSGALLKCPHCNKKFHETLFICPFCQKNAKRECLNCHEPVLWEADQCPHCKSRNLTKE